MIRKTISFISAFFLLIVLFASCSKSEEYTRVIPADANYVTSIDVKSIVEKSGMNDASSKVARDRLLNLFASSSEDVNKKIKEITDDPSKMGIDFRQPIYTFSSPILPLPVVTAKVSSKSNLKDLVELLQKQQLAQPLVEESDYSYTQLVGNCLLAFNKKTMFFVSDLSGEDHTQFIKEGITKLLHLSKDSCFVETQTYKDFDKQAGDVKFVAAVDQLPQNYSSPLEMCITNPEMNLKKLMLMGVMSFESGKMDFKFNYYSSDEKVKAQLSSQAAVTKPISNTFLSYFPASTLGIMSVGTNGQELYKMMQEESGDDDALYKSVSQLFKSLKGDLTIGLIAPSVAHSFDFVAYARVDNSDALKTFFQQKKTFYFVDQEMKGIKQIGPNDFLFSANNNNLYIGVRGNMLYLTNSESLYKQVGKPVGNSLQHAIFVPQMSGKNFFSYVDANAVLNNPVVLSMKNRNPEYGMYYSLATKFRSLQVSSDKSGVTHCELLMRDTQTNALKQILDFGKSFVGL